MSVKHNKKKNNNAGGGNAAMKRRRAKVPPPFLQCPSKRKSCRIARRERTRFPMK